MTKAQIMSRLHGAATGAVFKWMNASATESDPYISPIDKSMMQAFWKQTGVPTARAEFQSKAPALTSFQYSKRRAQKQHVPKSHWIHDVIATRGTLRQIPTKMITKLPLNDGWPFIKATATTESAAMWPQC